MNVPSGVEICATSFSACPTSRNSAGPMVSAARLMRLGAAVSLVDAIVTLSSIGQIKASALAQHPLLSASAARAVANGAAGAAVFGTVVSIGLWLWLAGSAFCVLRYLHGWMRLQRARRRWQPARLADDVILISDGLCPAVIGLFRTRLVVPQWVLTAPAERQRMILQHER